jgi:hypothetical protein
MSVAWRACPDIAEHHPPLGVWAPHRNGANGSNAGPRYLQLTYSPALCRNLESLRRCATSASEFVAVVAGVFAAVVVGA